MLWRLPEGSRLLVPLGSIGSQRLQALCAALGVEPREWNRLAAGVDAFHQILVWRQLRLAAHRDERLDPRTRSRRSSLAHLLPVSNITLENLPDVVKAGVWTWADICKGIETTDVCKKNNK